MVYNVAEESVCVCVFVCARMLEEIICVHFVGKVCVYRSSYDSVCLVCEE